ncbi:MAG: peptidylprolyl isomerase [Clostridiales bacterium]|nr:peptidylprolyl isomerase [Clostridiales bacterium]
MKKQVLIVFILLTILITLGGCKKVEFNQLAMPEKGDEIAIIKTNMGDIYVRLFKKDAPDAVENFTTHAKNGYYDGIIFHRVIKDFMIQGGDPTGTGRGGQSIWGSPFPDYFTGNLVHFNGALSMANSGPNTNSSQFFIVQTQPLNTNPDAEAWFKTQAFSEVITKNYMENGGTPWLDNKHMVFGQVFKGMDVVNAISDVVVDNTTAKPDEDVVMLSIELTKYSGQ